MNESLRERAERYMKMEANASHLEWNRLVEELLAEIERLTPEQDEK